MPPSSPKRPAKINCRIPTVGQWWGQAPWWRVRIDADLHRRANRRQAGAAIGAEIQKTSKTSTEYRKTENETHEVERGGDYEKSVVSSETHEISVKRSETVETRRGVGRAFQPGVLPADWPAALPDQFRLSLSGVRPETSQDAARFDGNYILDLVDRDAAVRGPPRTP
ncbi:MAG TPA: hypothetical protein VNH11_21390 [Pirellulales bacterium]|nr:hypothetical protein [Pirellulales bacterium]